MAPPEKYWISEHEGIPVKTKNIFNEYLLSIKVENKAEATVSKYRQLLEKFLSECNPLEELTSDLVREWLIIFSENKSPRTIDLMLSSLSSFLKFCIEEEYMEEMVLKNRWRPKIPHSMPKYLDDYEYARIVRISEQLPIRDRALVLFLFSTGCRVFEVSNLNMEDVHLEKRTANIMGKGKKIRSIYFSEECALVLRGYLETRSMNPEEPLFLNKFGNRLQDGGIRKLVQKLGKKAGLKQSFHPHCCRHTFATNMLARGADLQVIADLLGHSDINTTRIYAQIPTEEMMLKYQNIMG